MVEINEVTDYKIDSGKILALIDDDLNSRTFGDFFSDETLKVIVTTVDDDPSTISTSSFLKTLKKSDSSLDDFRYYGLYHNDITKENDIHSDYNTLRRELNGSFYRLDDSPSYWYHELFYELLQESRDLIYHTREDIKRILSLKINEKSTSLDKIYFKDNRIRFDRKTVSDGDRIEIRYEIED